MSIFNLKCKNIDIKFEQGSTYENFIGQFQKNCPKILCVVDGTKLNIYDKKDIGNKNIKFDYVKQVNNIQEYYFRDINDDTLYCVFGEDAASYLYPDIKSMKKKCVDNEISSINNKCEEISSMNVDKGLEDTPYEQKEIIGRKINIDYIKNLNINNRLPPDVITIFDGGEKILFPNYDHDIHISKYQ